MYTRITVVLDRTGSMEPIRRDIIGGYNRFLAEQRQIAKTRITLIQFDSQNTQEIVYSNLPISEAPELTEATYVPRASTPLYDAVGRAIVETDQSGMFSSDPEIARAKTVFVIITDGQENASQEYTSTRVREMIDKKREAGWQFVFLSADLNSFAQAEAMGFPMAASMAYDANSQGTRDAFDSLSYNTVAFASGSSSGMDWSTEQRSQQTTDGKRNKSGDKAA